MNRDCFVLTPRGLFNVHSGLSDSNPAIPDAQTVWNIVLFLNAHQFNVNLILWMVRPGAVATAPLQKELELLFDHFNRTMLPFLVCLLRSLRCL